MEMIITAEKINEHNEDIEELKKLLKWRISLIKVDPYDYSSDFFYQKIISRINILLTKILPTESGFYFHWDSVFYKNGKVQVYSDYSIYDNEGECKKVFLVTVMFDDDLFIHRITFGGAKISPTIKQMIKSLLCRSFAKWS